MARATRWLRERRPEDLLLNGLLVLAVVGAIGIGYWSWRADTRSVDTTVRSEVVSNRAPTSTSRPPATTTTVPTPTTTVPAFAFGPPLVLPDTGGTPARRPRRGTTTTTRSPFGLPVPTVPPQTSPPTVPPPTTPTTATTPTTTGPPPTTTTTGLGPPPA